MTMGILRPPLAGGQVQSSAAVDRHRQGIGEPGFTKSYQRAGLGGCDGAIGRIVEATCKQATVAVNPNGAVAERFRRILEEKTGGTISDVALRGILTTLRACVAAELTSWPQ